MEKAIIPIEDFGGLFSNHSESCELLLDNGLYIAKLPVVDIDNYVDTSFI